MLRVRFHSDEPPTSFLSVNSTCSIRLVYVVRIYLFSHGERRMFSESSKTQLREKESHGQGGTDDEYLYINIIGTNNVARTTILHPGANLQPDWLTRVVVLWGRGTTGA